MGNVTKDLILERKITRFLKDVLLFVLLFVVFYGFLMFLLMLGWEWISEGRMNAHAAGLVLAKAIGMGLGLGIARILVWFASAMWRGVIAEVKAYFEKL